MTPSGIEPATFRFVAQYLNHCATAGPNSFIIMEIVLGLFVMLSLVTWEVVHVLKIFRFECYYIICY
jgi:hypothetical protein